MAFSFDSSMNSNLRTIDADKNTNPIYHTQSSSHSSAFMIRAGVPNQNLNGSCVEMDMIQERFEMREALVREIEKERIRAQIIAEELERRRLLEEEVRNELRMERDRMAMNSNGGFPSQFMPVSLPPSHVNRLEPRFLHQHSPEERIVMSIADKHGHGVHRGFSVSPFQQFGESSKITGIPKQQPKDTEKEVIVLSKRSGESLCGTKRKSVTSDSEGSSETRADISKKKRKKDWNCAICQVSSTSERALNDHLQGRKHQLKEAALIAEKTGANIGLGVAPKKIPPETSRTPITPESSDTKAEATKKENKSNNFNFWCEICQKGAHSEDVMDNHKKGKKHLNKQFRKGKVNTEAPATEKVDEKTETETKNALDVEMVASEIITDTEIVIEAVANEAKSETEKEVVVEGVETVIDDKQDVTEYEADTVVEAIKKENQRSNNFKFWCEMCQIGAHSDDVMNNHKKGKKHLNKQLQKGKVDTEAPATEKVCDADEETETETKNVVDVEMVANEAKSETEPKKEVVVEAVETVIDDKQDVTEDEADTMVEDEAEV